MNPGYPGNFNKQPTGHVPQGPPTGGAPSHARVQQPFVQQPVASSYVQQRVVVQPQPQVVVVQPRPRVVVVRQPRTQAESLLYSAEASFSHSFNNAFVPTSTYVVPTAAASNARIANCAQCGNQIQYTFTGQVVAVQCWACPCVNKFM
eukprot:TRINITY_DN307_c0_g1_i2.p1 TRINITY_DN307_c0_g1~~TRINITY_DN307_c0_g1_i2.p1  ORF type:complete len:169 (-),score=25.02 TRINITY_DN307_c0_g1_i2:48-491(-)